MIFFNSRFTGSGTRTSKMRMNLQPPEPPPPSLNGMTKKMMNTGTFINDVTEPEPPPPSSTGMTKKMETNKGTFKMTSHKERGRVGLLVTHVSNTKQIGVRQMGGNVRKSPI